MTNRLTPTNLRCEYLENPMGIDVQSPRLSWQLTSVDTNMFQSAYRVLVATSIEDLRSEENLIWDSGWVTSANTLHIPYEGKPLQAEKRYYWIVQVCDHDNQLGGETQPAHWQMGLGNKDQWQAQWIGFATQVDEAVRPDGQAGNNSQFFGTGDDILNMRPPAYFRHTFELQQSVTGAFLYITALGLYDASINGQPITDNRLTPGWRDYHQTIEYQIYDVSQLLKTGGNAIGVILADGWYAGYLGPWGRRGVYGDTASLLFQMQIILEDGSQITIGSDQNWKASEGAIRYSEIYHGEYYDTTQEEVGWDKPEFNDGHWQLVTLFDMPDVNLNAQPLPPIRVTQELIPVNIEEIETGVYQVDMSQNFAGWIRLIAEGESGTTIKLRFAETLLHNGRIDTLNLNAARATDTWVLRGDGEEIFEPRFTYHGFRYVEITGYPGSLTLDKIVGCVLHTDLTITGHIETSSPLVNKIIDNTLWSQRSNFYSVPTDCPQRAERLGWTGDLSTFGLTGAYLMDCGAYYSRVMAMLVEAQSDEGAFSNVVPRVVVTADGAPAFGDAGIYLPWLMYQLYGDQQLVEGYYPAMTSWMNYIAEANPDHLWINRRNPDFGDWLAFDDFTPPDVLATAIWAMDALWMVDMANILGYAQDAEDYTHLHEKITFAFQEAYVMQENRIKGDTQAVYVLALAADILPEDLQESAINRLAQLIEERDWHLSTGFVASSRLMSVLCDNGRADIAYRLLLQDTLPSWGHMIQQGATTLWERWDGDVEMRRLHGLDDSSRTFTHPTIGELIGMNSFNHFSLGSVVGWIYQYVLGIQPASGGFQTIRIQPHIAEGLTYARGHYDTIRGRVAVHWNLLGGKLHFEIQIPANVEAKLILPSINPEGDIAFNSGAIAVELAIALNVGSGIYRIQTTWNE